MRSVVVLVLAACLAVSHAGSVNPYNENLAKQLKNHAFTAYCPEYEVSKWTCKGCTDFRLQDYKVFSNSALHAFGYAGYDATNDIIVFSFRGTDPLGFYQDIGGVLQMNVWLDAISAICIPMYVYGKQWYNVPTCTGYGFYQAIDVLSSQFTQHALYLNQRYPTKQVYVTGHSLGAAMAVHATIRISSKFLSGGFPKSRLNIYNFGQPRVGDSYYRQLVSDIATDAYRITNKRDPVTMVPLRDPFNIGFTHSMQEVYYPIDDAPKYVASSSNYEDPNGILRIGSTEILSVLEGVLYANDHQTYFGSLHPCAAPIPLLTSNLNSGDFERRTTVVKGLEVKLDAPIGSADSDLFMIRGVDSRPQLPGKLTLSEIIIDGKPATGFQYSVFNTSIIRIQP
eukprot:Colp12_sorted_trinity150504_noHs@32847